MKKHPVYRVIECIFKSKLTIKVQESSDLLTIIFSTATSSSIFHLHLHSAISDIASAMSISAVSMVIKWISFQHHECEEEMVYENFIFIFDSDFNAIFLFFFRFFFLFFFSNSRILCDFLTLIDFYSTFRLFFRFYWILWDFIIFYEILLDFMRFFSTFGIFHGKGFTGVTNPSLV